MAHLPEHVGGEEQQGQARSFPQLAALEMTSERRGEHGHGEAEGEEEQADLVEQPQADDQAERTPQPRVVCPDESRQEQDRDGPEHEVEGVHRVEAGQGQVHRGDRHREGRERLGEASPAELAGQTRGQPHEETEEQGRHEAHREERVAQEPAHGREHHDRQRGVIDIAPVEMIGAGEVIEFVPEQAVSPAGGQM